MALPQINPRQVAPHLLRGAYGAHILARMWRLSKLPPTEAPLHLFLLKHTDIVLILTGGPIVWHIVERRYMGPARHGADSDSVTRLLTQHVAHQLRQVFTVILLGLGLIKRRSIKNQAEDIPRLVDRLEQVVAEGIQAVNVLDPPSVTSRNGREREFGA